MKAATLETGLTHFWSRSRLTAWRKGESSGHVQHVQRVYADCDADTLLVQVHQEGPACHTNNPTCFFTALQGEGAAAPTMLVAFEHGSRRIASTRRTTSSTTPGVFHDCRSLERSTRARARSTDLVWNWFHPRSYARGARSDRRCWPAQNH